MVSHTVEYALRAVIYLARRQGGEGSLPAQQIAEATGVPPNYLPKVLAPLVRAGILSAVRGVRGGYGLLRDPAELRVLDVVSCVDPIARVDRCPKCLPEHQHQLCPLHRLLDRAAEGTEQAFAAVSIRDLVEAESRSESDPLSSPRPLSGV